MESLSIVRSGVHVYLWQTQDQIFERVPRPRIGNDFFEDPPITGEDYTCRGWESGAESFAGIFLHDRLVLGLYSLENVGREVIDSKVDEYTRLYEPMQPTLVPAESGSYWFWERGNSRIMIVNTLDSKGQHHLTIALGAIKMMDALRMNVKCARQDLFDAHTILTESGSKS